jgi:hypothetical protein
LGVEQECFARAKGIFSTLPLLKIGICSVPLRDVPRSVAQRTTAKEKPAKFAVEAAEAALHFERLYRIQSFPEFALFMPRQGMTRKPYKSSQVRHLAPRSQGEMVPDLSLALIGNASGRLLEWSDGIEPRRFR